MSAYWITGNINMTAWRLSATALSEHLISRHSESTKVYLLFLLIID